MKININHPSFISFIEHVISNITTNVSVEKYFKNTTEQKLTDQLKCIKIMNNSIKSTIKLDQLEYKAFMLLLLKKSEELEKFEVSALLKDMISNFDNLYDVIKPIKKNTRKIKTDANNKDD